MEFGQYMFSLTKGASYQYSTFSGKSDYLYVFPIVKFMMQRPDNGNYVYEYDRNLLQEDSPKNFLPIEEKSLDHVVGLISEYFDKKMESLKEELNDAQLKFLALVGKHPQMESDINNLKKNNEKEPTQNRSDSIRQLEKGMRRLESKMKHARKDIQSVEQRIQYFKDAYDTSILKVKKDFEKAKKGAGKP